LYCSHMKQGTLHPLTELTNQAVGIFQELGFEVATGPEMETEWYNFDALNVPKDHPARDMQDTFFIKGEQGKVLRTHATNVTARMLEKSGKENRFPCAFVSIGKVYRNEATDATHEMQFYQIDGVMVGKDISVANLKAVLLTFYKRLLGDGIDIELRPSFFPFTEPSLEVWLNWNGRKLEMMGAGMIHPNVLRNLGVDPDEYQGFAFGGGLDRILMSKYNIPDVRLAYLGDARFNQF
jgi:phenylalanyl-tRNA synthetase alpha chain